MKTKTIEEKVKTVILEEIKTLANEAWCNPTDDNMCKMFNAVEFLKKVLKNDDYSSPLSPWQQPQPQPLPRDLIWGDNHIMAYDTLTDK